MKYSIPSGTALAVSHNIKIPFLKNCSKYILYGQIFVSQGHTYKGVGNSGYSIKEMGVTLATETQLSLGSVFIAGTVVGS